MHTINPEQGLELILIILNASKRYVYGVGFVCFILKQIRYLVQILYNAI